MTKNTNPNDTLDNLLSDLNHNGKPVYNDLQYPVQARLNSSLYAYVEAITSHAGTSRNKVMNQLVQLGVDQVLSGLDENVSLIIDSKVERVMLRLSEGKDTSAERASE